MIFLRIPQLAIYYLNDNSAGKGGLVLGAQAGPDFAWGPEQEADKSGWCFREWKLAGSWGCRGVGSGQELQGRMKLWFRESGFLKHQANFHNFQGRIFRISFCVAVTKRLFPVIYKETIDFPNPQRRTLSTPTDFFSFHNVCIQLELNSRLYLLENYHFNPEREEKKVLYKMILRIFKKCICYYLFLISLKLGLREVPVFSGTFFSGLSSLQGPQKIHRKIRNYLILSFGIFLYFLKGFLGDFFITRKSVKNRQKVGKQRGVCKQGCLRCHLEGFQVPRRIILTKNEGIGLEGFFVKNRGRDKLTRISLDGWSLVGITGGKYWGGLRLE
ncbi:hypothetical protein VP01_6030g1 [Puccinia sorghi]|uniref:Uncharacterized protein n=1 Tax=Puccinia sorghi TaxID=27349 RepID=A0A0L6UI58_9BASI|nr:hypothetical protein VP01_6030g1 [Puccinia sorghi]